MALPCPSCFLLFDNTSDVTAHLANPSSYCGLALNMQDQVNENGPDTDGE